MAIVGAGAVSGLMASWLSGAGQPPPVVCARSPFASFTIIGDGSGHRKTRHYPVAVVTSADAVSPVDWVLVTVNGEDTAEAKPWLDALADQDTIVVVLQDGVDQVERVESITAAAEIVPALIYAVAERTGRTRCTTIRHPLGALLKVPNTSAGRAFAQLMSGGVHVATSDDFLTESWRKLMIDIGASPIAALTRRDAGGVRVPLVERLCARLLAEIRSVGYAVGALLTDADVDDVMWLHTCYPDDIGSRALDDPLVGRPVECGLLLGAVVRAARSHNITVPLAETLFALTTTAGDRHRPEGRQGR
ncbi:ketopantoate reductase family protein [Mycobacteroides chelonae]|uniref:ketopantoate reductase family protein n=1 Tax=Mycobacteroides chelonae TaxID=1774 RepID=UPI002351F50F|nr:2-dehydropantoate 2-reductase N-terminal domain-containing protein [Mycobacteroides chelonae]